MACPCGLEVQQPWRSRDNPWSPASMIGGVFWVAFAVFVLIADLRPWFGWALLAALAAMIVVAGILQATRGHRAWCLTRRAVWFGLTTPGAPLRLWF